MLSFQPCTVPTAAVPRCPAYVPRFCFEVVPLIASMHEVVRIANQDALQPRLQAVMAVPSALTPAVHSSNCSSTLCPAYVPMFCFEVLFLIADERSRQADSTQ
eukprot:gene31234-6384_t